MTDLFARDFDDLRVGDAFATRGRTIGGGDVSLFAGLTGDHHPLHTDATFAAAHPFGGRVAHGMLVASCAAGLVPFDPTRVLALRRVRDVVFKKPVALGDTIRVQGALAGLSPLGDDAGLVTVELRVRNQDDALVCRMGVDVLWKRGPAPAPAPAPAVADAAREPSSELAPASL
jgi:acyl dehydratase